MCDAQRQSGNELDTRRLGRNLAGGMFLLGLLPAIAIVITGWSGPLVYLFFAVWLLGVTVPATVLWLGRRR